MKFEQDLSKVLNYYQAEIIIIGGGLAGLVTALHLSKSGHSVILIEKNEFPKHKVCGKYISNEVLPYLQQLGADPLTIGAKKIDRFLLSNTRGKAIECKLSLGGFGVSRYTLDYFLLQKAVQHHCTLIQDKALTVHFSNDNFNITTKAGNILRAKIVIGAFGKRSNIDLSLDRQFIKNRSPYVAVKTHAQGQFPDDLVALHNFNGGYCGVSKVENGNLNICYLATYNNFQRFKNIDTFNQQVLYKNPHLKYIFENTIPVFDQPLTISQISFSDKTTVQNHILMCGDAAGMIHPLCGNGMAMAIHSAKIASELIIQYFNQKILTRQELETTYTRQWNHEFRKRIQTGRILQNFFGKDNMARLIMYGITHIPGILPAIIRQTHGKPFNTNTV